MPARNNESGMIMTHQAPALESRRHTRGPGNGSLCHGQFLAVRSAACAAAAASAAAAAAAAAAAEADAGATARREAWPHGARCVQPEGEATVQVVALHLQSTVGLARRDGARPEQEQIHEES